MGIEIFLNADVDAADLRELNDIADELAGRPGDKDVRVILSHARISVDKVVGGLAVSLSGRARETLICLTIVSPTITLAAGKARVTMVRIFKV